MDEYIDRAVAVSQANFIHGRWDDVYVSAATLMAMPAADVAPVIHGQWEPGNPICPVCGGDKFKDLDADIWCDWKPDYCPNCGAKMDGGVDDG